MHKKDWNPELYLKYNKERIQPSIDLVARINPENPQSIIDIGCGPGNSTQVLAQSWPASKITGADNSPAMIEKAKKDFPKQEWLLLDAGKDEIPGKFDLVFSNAAVQWMPDHAALFRKLAGILTDNGVLAVQVPLFFDMPLGKSIANISREKRWADSTSRVNDLFTIHSYADYYDLLSGLFNTIEMWVTDYIHIMDSPFAILEMIRSTGLKPYLDSLQKEEDRNEFEKIVLDNIKTDYPVQENGKVLFPFKRLFFIVY